MPTLVLNWKGYHNFDLMLRPKLGSNDILKILLKFSFKLNTQAKLVVANGIQKPLLGRSDK